MQGKRRTLALLGALPIGMAMSTLLAGCEQSSVRAAKAPAATGTPRRIAILDWGLTEMILALGVVPVGVSRPPWYTRLDGDPPLPAGVADIGLLFQPNFEVLQSLAPDLLVITAWHAPLRARLERIAPTLTITRFAPGVDVYASLCAQARHLGEVLGRPRRARQLVRETDTLIHGLARVWRSLPDAHRPLYLIQRIDAAHVTVYGPASLPGQVLRRLGGTNAWRGDTDVRGAARTDLVALAQVPHAGAVVLAGPSPDAAALSQTPLWRALPFVKAGRVREIAGVYPDGALVAAMRFASRITSVPGGGAP
jgi:iron complex transport system substrate-binding protein